MQITDQNTDVFCTFAVILPRFFITFYSIVKYFTDISTNASKLTEKTTAKCNNGGMHEYRLKAQADDRITAPYEIQYVRR